MKKIMILALCAVVLLSGCRAAEPDVTQEQPEATVPVITEQVAEATEPTVTEPAVDWAEYEIVRQDHSIRNEADEVIILFYYDQVILEGEYEQINSIIAADEEAFLAGYDLAGMTELAETMGIGPEFPFSNNVTAAVTHNAGGVFSILMTREWFAGGVHNVDHYGMTFDLREDRQVTLAELIPDVTEERLKEIAWTALSAEYGDMMFESAYEDLQTYAMEDFLFYVRDGELFLTFSTYSLGPGAAGPMTVATGIWLG